MARGDADGSTLNVGEDKAKGRTAILRIEQQNHTIDGGRGLATPVEGNIELHAIVMVVHTELFVATGQEEQGQQRI